jgi:hypothetical protein
VYVIFTERMQTLMDFSLTPEQEADGLIEGMKKKYDLISKSLSISCLGT